MTNITTAELIATAPLGALISFSDGQPMPPTRFTRKLSAWKHSNGEGTLVEVCPDHNTFTLHLGDLGGAGVILMRTYRTYDLNTSLAFAVARQPAAGAVLCARVWAWKRKIDKITTPDGAASWLANNPGGELLLVGESGSLTVLPPPRQAA